MINPKIFKEKDASLIINQLKTQKLDHFDDLYEIKNDWRKDENEKVSFDIEKDGKISFNS